MRSLNPDQLRAFLAVVEGKSFSAAARRLHLSQPAISVQIRELERRFGVALIERLGKQAHPTLPGMDLVEAARRILRECDETETMMRRYREGWLGRVRIGTTNTALTHLLPPVLRRLGQDHPGIDLHVTNLPTRESVEGILQNRLDLALVTLPVEKAQLIITPLRSEMMVAVFAAGTRDLPDAVTPSFVLTQPLVMEHTRAALHDLVMQWLTGHGASPRIAMHLGTTEAMKSAVAAGLGMAIVPEIAIGAREPDILTRPLKPPIGRTIALIEHHSKPGDAAFEVVRAALRSLQFTHTEPKSKPRGGGTKR